MENEIFEKKLSDCLKNQPLAHSYAFNKLKSEGLMIATSSDQKFRIYSWDENGGGTMHTFKNIFQYQIGHQLFTTTANILPNQKETIGNGFYHEIFSCLLNGKMVYLTTYTSIACTSCMYAKIELFTINEGKLQNINLIKTTSGITHELGFDYDFFSVVDRPERPIKLIYFDAATTTIKIPVVIEKGKVTNRFITYRFTGKYFEKQTK